MKKAAISLALALAASALAQNPAVMTVKVFSDPQMTKPAARQPITFKSKGGDVNAQTNDYGMAVVRLPAGSYTVEMGTAIGPFACKECKVPRIPETDDEISGELQFYFDNEHIELKDVNFDTGKATLKPGSFAKLDPVAEGMIKNPNVRIEIAGHTDDVGNDESNMKLSQARAEAVRNYLVKKGVPADRLTARGYGETQPKVSNATKEGKAMNRRTEARILAQ
ncbi:MAG: OmpA family protein [Fibrobacterales bacterium]|nr:OmpA family protein [Fibrobacterales bacterium]